MWLLRTSGLIGNFGDDNPFSDEENALLVDAAEHFLAGGGTCSPGDWAVLTTPERAALVLANERLWATRVANILNALGAPLEAAKVIKPFDQGAAESKIGLAVAVAQAAAKLQGQVVK